MYLCDCNSNLSNFYILQSKPLKNLNGQICQICGDTVGLTATGDVFVACHECAFPLCHRCYEYERKNVNQSCPQCKTRYKSHKGSHVHTCCFMFGLLLIRIFHEHDDSGFSESPQMEGDDDEDDVDELENELKYGESNNTKIGWQWEEDADLSSSSGHDSQIPNPHLAYGKPVIF